MVDRPAPWLARQEGSEKPGRAWIRGYGHELLWTLVPDCHSRLSHTLFALDD